VLSGAFLCAGPFACVFVSSYSVHSAVGGNVGGTSTSSVGHADGDGDGSCVGKSVGIPDGTTVGRARGQRSFRIRLTSLRMRGCVRTDTKCPRTNAHNKAPAHANTRKRKRTRTHMRQRLAAWRHSKDGRSTRGSCPFHDDRTCCQHHRTQRVLCVYRPIPLWQQRWRARDVCGRHQRRCGRAEHCSQAITTAVPSEPIAFLPPGKCGTVTLT
jgi:hypothetical protein